MKFLHIGCGLKRKSNTTREFAKDHWLEVTYDIDVQVQPDIVGSMTDMSAVPADCFDAVYSSHNIEHLFAHDVVIAMREIQRILKPSGYLILACPDLQSVSAEVANGNLLGELYKSRSGPIAAIDIIYGYRPSLAAGNHFMAHKSGFTRDILRDTVRYAGFVSTAALARPAPFYDLWLVATKERVDDELVRHYAEIHFPLN